MSAHCQRQSLTIQAEMSQARSKDRLNVDRNLTQKNGYIVGEPRRQKQRKTEPLTLADKSMAFSITNEDIPDNILPTNCATL